MNELKRHAHGTPSQCSIPMFKRRSLAAQASESARNQRETVLLLSLLFATILEVIAVVSISSYQFAFGLLGRGSTPDCQAPRSLAAAPVAREQKRIRCDGNRGNDDCQLREARSPMPVGCDCDWVVQRHA